MYSPQLEELIEAVLADGVITDKERAVLHKRALAEGVDPDELDVVLDGRIVKMQQSSQPIVPPPISPRQHAQEIKPSKPSSKYGVVEKCPQCGAVVEAASVKCNECGYVFRGIQANSSRQKLSEMLLEIERKSFKTGGIMGLLGGSDFLEEEKRDAARARVISSFPVPNSKDDLLEFILFLQPYTKKSSVWSDPDIRETIKAYKTKYEECINKARIFFADDPHFKPILGSYKKGWF